MSKSKPRQPRTTRTPLIVGTLAPGDDGSWSAFIPPPSKIIRRLRVVRRAAMILLWTLGCFPVQGLLLVLPGRADRGFSRFYWRGMCRIMGLRVQIVGEAAGDGRPVVFTVSHTSWLDVLVLGGNLDAAFIAKEEIGQWPVVNWIATLGRTVYVRRKRTSTARERDEMRARLASGDNLILFPEGTTSDGSRVLPFRSAFMSIAEMPVMGSHPPLVQPVSLVYDRLAGLSTGRMSRTVFGWFGDMDLATHFWRLAQERGMRATLLLHAPLDPADFASRKALNEAAWRIVAAGSDVLRQNRPPVPLGRPEV